MIKSFFGGKWLRVFRVYVMVGRGNESGCFGGSGLERFGDILDYDLLDSMILGCVKSLPLQ